mmetsp:Transcript_46169/g.128477  ORF Transcript_46169/g.128477 Transcript_46169/m.128477 type:complete len:270 (-) Transcript_46169:482-1291(-)
MGRPPSWPKRLSGARHLCGNRATGFNLRETGAGRATSARGSSTCAPAGSHLPSACGRHVVRGVLWVMPPCEDFWLAECKFSAPNCLDLRQRRQRQLSFGHKLAARGRRSRRGRRTAVHGVHRDLLTLVGFAAGVGGGLPNERLAAGKFPNVWQHVCAPIPARNARVTVVAAVQPAVAPTDFGTPHPHRSDVPGISAVLPTLPSIVAGVGRFLDPCLQPFVLPAAALVAAGVRQQTLGQLRPAHTPLNNVSDYALHGAKILLVVLCDMQD